MLHRALRRSQIYEKEMLHRALRRNKIYEEEMQKYNSYSLMNLNLNMSRGKPSPDQLNLTDGILDVLGSDKYVKGSVDYRNYGILDGIPEAKKLFSELCGVKEDEICVMGNSSLNIMLPHLSLFVNSQ